MAAKKQYYSQAGAMSKPKEVTVKKGDTMWGITKASKGTTSNAATAKATAQTAKMNPQIKNPNVIHPGDKIKVDRAMTTSQGKTGPSTKRGTANYSPGAEAIARSKKSSSSSSSGRSSKTTAAKPTGSVSSSGYGSSAVASAKKANAAKRGTPNTRTKPSAKASSYAKGS
jgi:LysM domain-containing protein